MNKKVLFFPGQASQYVGMGKDIYDASGDVRELYELAATELGADIAKISFEGPSDELKRTRFTQPAILLHSLGVMKFIGDRIGSFDFACGHSLGEYCALAAAGALSFEDAVKAVVRRATLMEEACQKNKGTMAAIIGLSESQVAAVCEEASSTGVVVPANFNSKTQIAISGSIDAINEAARLAKEAGAKRAMVLEVGGAFHSPLMESARDGMREYLETIEIKDTGVPVVANVTAQPVSSGEEIKKLLVEQIISPVRWSHTMNFLVNNSVTELIEIGPGKVLAGLAKRDMRPEKSTNLDTLADIETFLSVTA